MKRFQKVCLVFALGVSILCNTSMIQSAYAAEATNTNITVEKVDMGEGLPTFAQQQYETSKARVIIKNYKLPDGKTTADIPRENFEVDGYTYKFGGIEEVSYDDDIVYEVTFISPKAISERSVGVIEFISEMETSHKVFFTLASIALVLAFTSGVIRFKNRKNEAN